MSILYVPEPRRKPQARREAYLQQSLELYSRWKAGEFGLAELQRLLQQLAASGGYVVLRGLWRRKTGTFWHDTRVDTRFRRSKSRSPKREARLPTVRRRKTRRRAGRPRYRMSHSPGRGMKSRYVDYFGPRVVTIFKTGQVIATRDYAGYQQITAGPIIKGNFKSPNPWSYTVDTVFYQTGDMQEYLNGELRVLTQGLIPNGNLPSAWAPNPDVDPNLYNKAVDKLYDQVRGGLDLSIDLAEIGQTRRMVRQVATFEKGSIALYDWVGSLPAFKGKVRAGKIALDFAKTLGNKWLEYQYGWRPLINGIYAAADESLRYVVNRTQRFQAKVALPFQVKDSTVTVNGQTYKVQTTYNGTQFCVLTVDFLNYDRDLSRWTSLNPLSIAWELMPYSFVIDWFYNVGGYLRNAESSLLYNNRFRGGYMSRGVRWSGSYASRPIDAGNQKFLNICASRQLKQFNRSVLSSAPFPQTPSIKAKLGNERLFSAAALLGQFIAPVKHPKPSRVYDTSRPFVWPKAGDYNL